MPRKRKTKEEKERIIEKSTLSQEETNSLEQRIEKDEEKIDISELKEFLEEPVKKKSSPSLEKVNAPQRIPTRLDRDLIESQPQNVNPSGEEDPFKYIPTDKKQGETKYFHYEGRFLEEITPRTEIPNLGKGNPFERREIGFESSPQARISMQNSSEKYIPVKRVEKEKLGKENPLQRKEIKYNPDKY